MSAYNPQPTPAPNQSQLDLRLLKVSIAIGDQLLTFAEGFYITVKGSKYANPIQNEAEIVISNLNAQTRNFILTETSPYNANYKIPKVVTIYAGRVSTGYTQVYVGDVTQSTITQPPDIRLTIKCCTGQFLKSQLCATTGAAKQKLSAISSQVAAQLGLKLNFQANDKLIGNYGFSGAQLKQIQKLGDAGAVSAYQDDNELVVKNLALPLPDSTTVVNLNTGMIGIPEITEQGIKVTFLYNNATKLGGAVQVTSQLNPAANGTYVIYKLEFDLTSRDNNFYLIAQCARFANVVTVNGKNTVLGNT
jgi:predicted outer membrane repeat protein